MFPPQIKEGVESTELALAFKLRDSASDMNIQPEKQPVFAFLPLRSFGFRFIIQGLDLQLLLKLSKLEASGYQAAKQ